VQLRSAKLGTPELGKFSQSCRTYLPGALSKGPFVDGPSRQRGHRNKSTNPQSVSNSTKQVHNMIN
jgi:hypothetical protein